MQWTAIGGNLGLLEIQLPNPIQRYKFGMYPRNGHQETTHITTNFNNNGSNYDVT